MRHSHRIWGLFLAAVLIVAPAGMSEAAPQSPGEEMSSAVKHEIPDCFLGAFFTSNQDVAMECYTSADGIHMAHLFRSDSVAGRDPSIQYYHRNFYVCLVSPENTEPTFTISRSPDCKHWTTDTYTVIPRGTDCRAIWAPDLFIDEDGSAYVYFAKQRETIPETGEMKFDIYVSRSANIETEPFAPALRIDLPPRSDSYIDAQVRKINGQYYMIAKNEALVTGNSNKSPLLLKSFSPMLGFSEVESWPLRYIRGYEGFSIASAGNQVYVYADSYGDMYDAVQKSRHTVWIADRDKIETGPYRSAYIVSDRGMRHGSVILLTDEYAKGVLAKLGYRESKGADPVGKVRKIPLTHQSFGEKTGRDDQVIIEHFAPAPDTIYIVPQKTQVTIKSFENPYGVNDVSFRFEATDNSVLRVLDQWEFSGQDSQKKTYMFRLLDGYWKYDNGEKINGGEMNEGTINKEVIKEGEVDKEKVNPEEDIKGKADKGKTSGGEVVVFSP